VVKKQLASHKIEWKIVESPTQHGLADLVIESLECDVAIIFETPLPSKHCETLKTNINQDCDSRRPPNKWVPDEIDLAVVFAPEIYASQ